MKKNKRLIGDILKIPLGDNSFCFGRVLEEPLIAFYDLKTNQIPPPQEIISLPVLFRLGADFIFILFNFTNKFSTRFFYVFNFKDSTHWFGTP